MTIADTRRDQMFPVLSPAQIEIARRFAAAPPRRYAPGATLFRVGESNVPAFIVLAGCAEAYRRDGEGNEELIVAHGPGEITGEISQLAGRAALAEGRAGKAGCEVLAFDAAHLRALIIGSAELGEVLMRAFILRRVALISEAGPGPVLLGPVTDPVLVRLQGFLERNGHPHVVLDPDTDEDGQAMVDRLGVVPDDLPIMLCPNGTVLRRPSDAEAAACLGILPHIDSRHVRDVVVVGAGPAGLATAVYAASEGLDVLVLDMRAFGGQAGASARIENYLGFPTGISGQALAGRAFTQAQKFGAEIAIPESAVALDCGGADRKPGDLLHLKLGDGTMVKARTVVIASGARYRKPDIAQLDQFENAGIAYWASPVEAKLCAGEEVALVGGGNSAGQAVVYLAPRVKRLRLVLRGDGLEASMSRYLIERIAALPNVELMTRTEIVAVEGDAVGHLARASFRNRDSGEIVVEPLRHLFLFIGADPNTDWLGECGVAVDAKGFVMTGGAGDGDVWQRFGRLPSPLETSVPGVFAVGDVRSDSTKRVAAAVGEGAQVVAAIHRFLG